MKLTIHGPNLYRQSKGTFHVHTADCRDNAREVKVNGSVAPYTTDLPSAESVAALIYADQLGEDPDATALDYVSDFHFAPCCKGLPVTDKQFLRDVYRASSPLATKARLIQEAGLAENAPQAVEVMADAVDQLNPTNQPNETEADMATTDSTKTTKSNGGSAQAAKDEAIAKVTAKGTQAKARKPAAKATKPKASKAKAAKPAAKPAAKVNAKVTEAVWPEAPAKMLLEYLQAEVSADVNAPNLVKPFIDKRDILRLHSSDWIAWLATQGAKVTKGQAAVPLRDAGLGVKTFQLPGEDRGLGFYTGPAPKGTEKLPRREGARARSAAE